MFNPLELLRDVNIHFTRRDFSVAIVGLGKMGLLHATILNLLCTRTVKYIVDKSRMIRIGGKLLIKNVEFLATLEKLIDLRDDVDAIYITTPTQSHFQLAMRLLEAGYENVFIEKPPTKNLEEFCELLDLGRRASVMIGFQKRFALPLRHAKILLKKGVLGELKAIYASIRSGDIVEPNVRFRDLGRGVLLDLGVHVIDSLIWLLDEKPEVESARYRSVYSGVDDHFEAVLRVGDIKIYLETTWSDPSYRLPEMILDIRGSSGELRVSEDFLKLRTREYTPSDVINELSLYRPQYYQGFPPVIVADHEYTIENMHFLSVIEHKTKPVTNLESCKDTMELVEELYTRSSHG